MKKHCETHSEPLSDVPRIVMELLIAIEIVSYYALNRIVQLLFTMQFQTIRL